jgi:redox-sensing transcriptional repressor
MFDKAFDIKMEVTPMSDSFVKFSVPVLRRLPMYHHFLVDLKKQGVTVVSATMIAEYFNLENIKVRKDLAVTGAVGKPKIGFNVDLLIEKIEEYLGWNKLNQSVLVGCGNLGTALMGYEGFANYGFEIIAAFDTDPNVIGKEVHGKPVLPLEKLPNLCRRMHIEIGILTAPPHSAQAVADLMVEGGIRGIWNFAPSGLSVPKSVTVMQQSMAGGLSVLVKKVEELKKY